ncbi:hypothetical protein [Dyadobacter sp. 676]|uniref:Uncharacterized protein n=1 Tax=Dyadobacter sp. 676 TaxID=3088362 RepID=A0AAU8FUS6_9BACT
MRRKIFRTISLMGLVPLGCIAQVSEGTKVGINTGRGLNAPRSGVFWTSPTEQPGVVGDFYIDSLWHIGNVKLVRPVTQVGGLESDIIAGIDIRYNVLNDELEVLADKAKKDIRVIRGSELKSFRIDSGPGPVEYVNLSAYDPKGELKGFAAVLVSGNITFLKAYKPRITKPNYNPGFGTGEKNTVVRLVNDYYLLSGGAAQKVTLNKKNLLALMTDKKADVDRYLKEHDLDFKDETQVADLVRYYNSK